MNINIVDTYRLYKEIVLLSESDRTELFDMELLQPFSPMFTMMNMPKDSNILGCHALSGKDNEVIEMIEQLKNADAWNIAHQAIELSNSILQKAELRIPDELLLGIILADPNIHANSKGYTGIGSCPGYIQILIAPNEYNLVRLCSCIAHEFHHNVLFNNIKWNFLNVSLSQYLAIEGLAESFAAQLYGEKYNGPWVSGIDTIGLKTASNVIGKNLDVKGFMEVRKYMYGDHPMVPEGQTLGIPYCAGYAVGYHAVQAYLRKYSIDVVKATKAFIEGEDIIKLSGYF